MPEAVANVQDGFWHSLARQEHILKLSASEVDAISSSKKAILWSPNASINDIVWGAACLDQGQIPMCLAPDQSSLCKPNEEASGSSTYSRHLLQDSIRQDSYLSGVVAKQEELTWQDQLTRLNEFPCHPTPNSARLRADPGNMGRGHRADRAAHRGGTAAQAGPHATAAHGAGAVSRVRGASMDRVPDLETSCRMSPGWFRWKYDQLYCARRSCEDGQQGSTYQRISVWSDQIQGRALQQFATADFLISEHPGCCSGRAMSKVGKDLRRRVGSRSVYTIPGYRGYDCSVRYLTSTSCHRRP